MIGLNTTSRSLLLLAPFFLWGTAMVAMKGTVPHLTPLFLATLRLFPAGLLVVAVALALGRALPQGWRAWLWITAFALVDGTLFQGFLAEGLFRTGAGLGSVMIDSQPMAVALLALWLFGERIGGWGWLGLGLGIGGISLLGLPDVWITTAAQEVGNRVVTGLALAQGSEPVLAAPLGVTWPAIQWGSLVNNGQWLMLMAALAMAIGTILSRYVSRHADPVMATGWHMIMGSVPLALGAWGWETPDVSQLTWVDYGALAYATVFGTAIAYALFFYFAAQGSLTSLSALTFLTPVFALLFGNLLLHEVLSPIQTGGVFLTLVSIVLINQRDRLSGGGSNPAAAPLGLDPLDPEQRPPA